MTAHLASLGMLAGLWLVLALTTSLAAALLWRPALHAFRAWHPERRARVAWLVAVAPMALPSLLVLVCALPGLLGALFGIGDHCAAHGDHPHFCPIHATVAMSPLVAATLAIFAALLVRIVRTGLDGIRGGVREARWLLRRRGGALGPGIHVLHTPEPIALTHGLRCPEIWISQGLNAALRDEERKVVLAHEQAHAERRDPARLLFAGIASTLHWPPLREALLSELRLATEQACDASAARQLGDPLRVAGTLLRVERLMRGARAPALRGAATLVDTSLPARVEALLAPEFQSAPAPRVWPTGWLALAAAILLASPLHHLAEHVLEDVLRSMVGVRGLF